MIANFFQSLERQKVDYLLISGQATVLYGAATFSEDIDLWVKPDAENLRQFLEVLRDCRGTYYKVTPAVSLENAAAGHGFHFIVPDEDQSEVFLDVMGAPPRVGSFESAATSAVWMDSEWGRVHTVGIRQLVEIKKTQRLEDYPVIGKLALAWFEQHDCRHEAADYTWAFQNIFSLEELRDFVLAQPGSVQFSPAELKDFAGQVLSRGEVAEPVETRTATWLQNRINQLQEADRLYWRKIIAEIKRMRSQGLLIPEGTRV